MNQDKLNRIIDDHGKWLRDEGGERADLRGVDLRGMDLRGANLRDAYLQDANLRDVDLRDAKLSPYQIPQEGTLTVWKKVQGHLVKLLVPDDALRTASIVGRKCRASKALVLRIEGAETVTSNGRGNGVETVYRVGEMVRADSYDPNPAVECSHGIHFFLTREEAEAFSG